MDRIKVLALLILGVFVVMGGTPSGAQTFQVPPVNPYQNVEAEFSGFSPEGDARYRVSVELNPVSQVRLSVHLRDAVPTVLDPVCGCTWEFAGDISTPTRMSFTLTAGSWYTDPVFVDFMVNSHVVSTMGPFQLPVAGSGLTPYGSVDFGQNRLHLHARGDARVGGVIHFDAVGALPGAASAIALSTGKTRHEFSQGGILLIQAETMVGVVLPADADGRFSVSLPIPAIPEFKGITFFTQAASDTMTDDLEPWFFSNGIQVDLMKQAPKAN